MPKATSNTLLRFIMIEAFSTMFVDRVTKNNRMSGRSNFLITELSSYGLNCRIRNEFAETD